MICYYIETADVPINHVENTDINTEFNIEIRDTVKYQDYNQRVFKL